MGVSDNLWFMFKIAAAVFILRKLKRMLLNYVFKYIIYVPNMPSADLKFPECNPMGFKSPSEYGYDFENIEVTTKDGVKLIGWFIKQKKPETCPTIIFFHGNAGNIGIRLPNIQNIYERNKANVVIVGYRGYGHSEGSPSEEGLQLDAEAVLDWTISNDEIDSHKVFIFGSSLGGAISIYLCSKRQKDVCGLIIENSFISIRKFGILVKILH